MNTPMILRNDAATSIADRWLGMTRPLDTAVALHLLSHLADGGSLKAWCALGTIDVVDPDGVERKGVKVPTAGTIYSWKRRWPDFAEAYTMAQEDRAASYADEVVDIADNTEGDFKIVKGRDGTQRVEADHDSVRRAEAKIKARSLALVFLAPHIYRDKVQRVDITSDGQTINADAGAVRNAEVADRVIALLRKAEARQQADALPVLDGEYVDDDGAQVLDLYGEGGAGEGVPGGRLCGEKEDDGQDTGSVWD